MRKGGLWFMLMQLNAWMCIKEWKKLTKKKWKSVLLLNCCWRISSYGPDITDKCFEGSWELYWAKTYNFTWDFFFFQWTAPDSFEPCQDMRYTPSPSQLLPPRDAPLLIVKKLGNMIYSAAAITVDMLSAAPRIREKIIRPDGGLIPVKKRKCCCRKKADLWTPARVASTFCLEKENDQ